MTRLWLALLVTACVAETGYWDEDGRDYPPDDFGVSPSTADDGYQPHAMTATRFGVFYEMSPDILASLQDPTAGVPQSANHAWIVTHSHGDAHASRALADLVHARADFYYAPAFDLWRAYPSWQTASDAELAQWAHEFRDVAIADHADGWAFNEVPTGAPTNADVQRRIAIILRGLHDADAKGRRLFGVVYFTEAAGTPSNWHTPGSAFFAAIDETSIALVVEHYHSNGFLCGQSEAALAAHFFALRDWLVASGEPAKASIASSKFTVLHSTRFAAGPSGWSGGDANKISLADFQRDLSRAALVTRETEGGYNRLSFGPLHHAMTEPGVAPRIGELFRWHYLHTAPQTTETACVAGAPGNCVCE